MYLINIFDWNILIITFHLSLNNILLQQKLKEVTSENFDEATRDGTTIVRFYDNECPNCQNTVDGWHDLIDDVVMGGYEIQMAQVGMSLGNVSVFNYITFIDDNKMSSVKLLYGFSRSTVERTKKSVLMSMSSLCQQLFFTGMARGLVFSF